MATKEISPLFKLPRELRDTIYEYVILGEDPNDLLKAACLNKNFYGEVLDVYYRKTPFLIWQGNYWNIQQSVSINTMSSIRNAKIDLSGWNLTAFHFAAGYKSFFVGTESKFMQAASLRTLTIQAKETRHPTLFIKEFIAIAIKSFPNLSTVAISFPIFEEFDHFLHWLDDRPFEEDEEVNVDYGEESYRREVKFCKDMLVEDKIPQSGVMTEAREMLGEESYYEEAMDLTPESELTGLNWESYLEKLPELPFFWGKAVWQATRGRTLKEKKARKELTKSQAMEVCELDSVRDWWNTW